MGPPLERSLRTPPPTALLQLLQRQQQRMPSTTRCPLPIIHPRPADGMHTNDINAPFAFNGTYHLFSDTAPLPNSQWNCSAERFKALTPAEQLAQGCCYGWSRGHGMTPPPRGRIRSTTAGTLDCIRRRPVQSCTS